MTQAWSNALFKSPLIDTDFEAWPHGPVCPQLYGEYKGYGWTNIPRKDDNSSSFSKSVLSLLESVWLTYGDKEADELEALTHQELPWKKARIGLAPNDHSNKVISNQDMQDFYLSIYSGD